MHVGSRVRVSAQAPPKDAAVGFDGRHDRVDTHGWEGEVVGVDPDGSLVVCFDDAHCPVWAAYRADELEPVGVQAP